MMSIQLGKGCVSYLFNEYSHRHIERPNDLSGLRSTEMGMMSLELLKEMLRYSLNEIENIQLHTHEQTTRIVVFSWSQFHLINYK